MIQTEELFKRESSCSNAFLASLNRGAEGRSEQHRGLRTKALMRDLGTRLECRHRVFVRTGKVLWKQINSFAAGLPLGQ